MSRAFDFVVCTVLWCISLVIHRITVELFAPESPLHSLASDGTAALNGAQRADLWFQILSIWLPLMVMGGSLLYVLFKEYRRSVATAARNTRRPR